MLLRLWILFCAMLTAAGWILSLFRGLNAVGYALVLVLFIACARAGATFLCTGEPWHLRRKLRRLVSARRLLPLLFAAMTVVLLCRGLFIPPYHGDAMCYRIPRMLHWIAEGRWFWIDAQDSRLNTRGLVAEWLTLPLFVAGGWDRLMFVPNWICVLFFPQVVFQVWRDWGVSSRMAWLWMWLLPAGFCYSLQACNSSNDILGTFFALAAFALLRERQMIPPVDLVCSLLSIALASGVKLTMAPLILPWLIVALARRHWYCRWPRLAMAGAAWAAIISFVPNVAANLLHVGDLSGLSLEPYVFRPVPYLDRLAGNLYVLILDNIAVPAMGDNLVVRICLKVIPPGPMILHRFENDTLYIYPYFAVEQEGIGPNVVAAAILIFLLAGRRKFAEAWHERLGENPWRWLLHTTMWALFVACMWVNTAAQVARLISAYYPYLLSTVFAGRRWPRGWRRSAINICAAAGLGWTLMCLVFSTDFPLIPVGIVYDERTTFEKRQEAALRQFVPASETSIGVMRFWNEWESWAWKPYGSRRIYELPVDPAPADLAAKNIHYIIITQHFLKSQGMTIGVWTQLHHAELAGELLDRPDKDPAWGIYIVRVGGAAEMKPSPQRPTSGAVMPPS